MSSNKELLVSVQDKLHNILSKVQGVVSELHQLQQEVREELPSLALERVGEKRTSDPLQSTTPPKLRKPTYQQDNPLLLLGAEILNQIISRLDIQSIIHFSETCKYAQELTKSEEIWEKINQNEFQWLKCAPLQRLPQDQSYLEFFQRRVATRNNWASGSHSSSMIPTSTKLSFLEMDPVNGNLLTTASTSDLVEWDLLTGLQMTSFHVQSGCTHFSLSRERLAVSSSDTVRVYDRSPQKNYLYHLTGLFSFVNRLKFFGNQLLLTGLWDGYLKVFRASDGSLISTISGHNNPVYCLDVSGSLDSDVGVDNPAISGRMILASGSSDRSIKLWDLASNQLVGTLRSHTKMINAVQFSDNHSASRIFSGSKDATVKLWDCNTAECVQDFIGHSDSVNTLQFDGGNLLVTGSSDSTIQLWDLRQRRSYCTLRGHSSAVNCLQIDEGRIVSCGGDRKIFIWDFKKM